MHSDHAREPYQSLWRANPGLRARREGHSNALIAILISILSFDRYSLECLSSQLFLGSSILLMNIRQPMRSRLRKTKPRSTTLPTRAREEAGWGPRGIF